MIQQSFSQEIPLAVQKVIVRDYLSGMSILAVQQKYRNWPKRTVSMLLHQSGVVRPQNESGNDPSPEEIERLRDLTRDSWSPGEASGRWVGRVTNRYAEASRVLSRLIPD